MFDAYSLLFLSVLFKSLAEFFTKCAALSSVPGELWSLLLNRWFVLCVLSLGIQAIFWTLALRKVKVSTAYPWMSLSVVIGLCFSRFAFGESVSCREVIGALCIVSGIVLISQRTQEQ